MKSLKKTKQNRKTQTYWDSLLLVFVVFLMISSVQGNERHFIRQDVRGS